MLYTYTSDKGATLYDYLRCDTSPDGSFVIDFTFITPASKFDTTIDDLTAMLDGIQVRLMPVADGGACTAGRCDCSRIHPRVTVRAAAISRAHC